VNELLYRGAAIRAAELWWSAGAPARAAKENGRFVARCPRLGPLSVRCLSQRGQKPAIARASPPDPLIKDQADLNSSFAVFAIGIVHSTSAHCKAEA